MGIAHIRLKASNPNKGHWGTVNSRTSHHHQKLLVALQLVHALSEIHEALPKWNRYRMHSHKWMIQELSPLSHTLRPNKVSQLELNSIDLGSASENLREDPQTCEALC